MNKDNATKLKSILIFFDLLNKVNQKEIQYFKKLYLQSAENFEDCIDFLLSLDLICLTSGYIELTSQLNKFLLKQPNENEIKNFLLKKLLIKRNIYVWDFLERFCITNDKYIFTPQISENLRFSDLRNLLIELEFISFNPSEKFHEIAEKYIPHFINELKEHSLNPEKLKRILEEQDRIGKCAELEIIDYEKTRLSSHKVLLGKIEHKSLVDSTAGYDIKSFTVGNDTSFSDRFIEVKAISSFEKKFYISRNELETSQKYGLNYYLYLLPVLGNDKFDLANLMIIQDPSSEIFNGLNWIAEPEHFSVKQKEE